MLPTPQELGFPEKYDGWRPAQEEALRWLLTSTKRVKAMVGPTGFGKSAVYVAYALITKRPTAFVTDSRALQDQLMDDFAQVGMVDIRGRANYECHEGPDMTCEDGYAGSCGFRGTHACPSSAAEMKAATSMLVVTNYTKWTAAKKYGTGMSHFTQVVFDEGHEAPHALERTMQVTISHNERERYLLIDPPSDITSLDNWKEWAFDAAGIAEELMMQARRRMREPGARLADTRRYHHMRNLTRRLGILKTMRPADWVMEERERAFQFDPIRAGRYGESHMLLRIPSVVVVSATLRPKTLFMLGIPQTDFDFREFDSDFPPDRCPIYWVPTMRVDARAESFAKLWLRIKQILAQRRDRKGIIHTVSYLRREEMMAALGTVFVDRMIVNPKGEAPTPVIRQFKQAPPGTVLVSPSVSQGYDFPGPECEFQVLMKIPFPPPSAIQKARTEEDKEYPYYLAMQKMVQTFGRGMRSRTDRCENFIPDDHIEWFVHRYGHLAPRSFSWFLKRADNLPPPPEKL